MLHDCYISAPMFGPNTWNAVVEPASGGGLPRGQSQIVMSLKFKDGGAYEFHSAFERIRDRLHQVMVAAEVDRPANNRSAAAISSMPAVNLSAVHLDELPTYEASGRDQMAPQPEPPTQLSIPQPRAAATAPEAMADGQAPAQGMSSLPMDAPPGYEEAQQQSVQ
jgi:WW domain-binding protein 2